ncbi:MAG: hypothetical protein JWR67_391 [Mucilaginibacter sp.]|nr:hypothetical protein [Mucilaginibacter sp.]MDB5109277.1 hypothetical protein [Mucilaginibacter sp.]
MINQSGYRINMVIVTGYYMKKKLQKDGSFQRNKKSFNLA